MKKLGVSLRELFERFDRPALRPMPPTLYELPTRSGARSGGPAPHPHRAAHQAEAAGLPVHLPSRRPAHPGVWEVLGLGLSGGGLGRTEVSRSPMDWGGKLGAERRPLVRRHGHLRPPDGFSVPAVRNYLGGGSPGGCGEGGCLCRIGPHRVHRDPEGEGFRGGVPMKFSDS